MTDRKEPGALWAYGVLAGVYAVAQVALLRWAETRGRPIRDVRLKDVALGALAVHRLSRLVAKDKVTRFVREPFTEFVAPAGHGETKERPRRDGRLRNVVGQLLGCPYCLSMWLATPIAWGFALRPDETRVFATMLATSDLANLMQRVTPA